MAVDLNRLRTTVLQNQAQGVALPTDPSRQVVVGKEGQIYLGDQAPKEERMTQVPQETFAAKR